MTIKPYAKSIALLLFVLLSATAKAQQLHINNDIMQKLQLAEVAINNLYVDSVDETKLVEDAIRGMLKQLDPHSSYTTAKETQSLNEPMMGSFEGVGIQFNMAQDTLLVIQTVSGGPSEKVGILAGDRIVTVNDTTIAGVKMTREEIMRRLRGPKGTIARLGIVRRGIPGMLTFKVKRDKIPVTTIDAAYIIRPGVGYVRISSFGMTTYDEFMESVKTLKQQGMKDIIIDLQENGGGLLHTAVQIANEFLNKDDLIVYTKGRTTPRDDMRANGRGTLKDCKVVVLVNEYSASASEILSGAIQDHDRGTIVGRRSFGKGLVQRPIEFRDGSMMRLTIAHYYTPSGRCIQKPYTKGEAEDYAEDIEKRFKHGELYSKDSIRFDDSLRVYTLKKHRAVYGGGGIMPDEFVPLDTTQYTFYHRQLSALGITINATLKYVDQNRKSLKKKYPTFEAFEAGFEVPESMLKDIYKEAEEKKVKLKDEAERTATLPMLKNQLKALVARDLWEMSQYFKIVNEQNHVVRRAIEAMNGAE